MTELMRIDEPGQARALVPQWSAFLEMGFRPLYLAGCFWAAVAVALWLFAPSLLRGQLAGVIWHAHEMLWGFIATIAVGFLLTAGNNWTGMNLLKGRALGALGLLWVLARVGYLVPGAASFWLAAACELLFFAWAAAALGRAIYGALNQRNYGVPLLVLALGVADALFLLAAWQGDYVLLMQRFNAGLLCMAVVALLVARRVIPFFAMRAVPGLTIPMHTRSGHWQLGASGLAIAFGLLGWMSAMATFLAAAGVIALVQVLAWKPWAVRRVPLLWILYVGYAALGMGLLVAAAHASGWLLRAAWPVHVIGVAGFSVLIIGMVTRTALGHLGRPLRAGSLIVWCYVLVIAAAALRLLALLPTSWAMIALHASAGAWVLAFGLYGWRFFPMMIRPGLDQKATSVLKAVKISTPSRTSR
ncbi:NnrS family protein [Hydrogenophaga sp. BPS33]|uniref:NnrS family protein n=1 Tax=Hydrogenophaga sp. BPS33 TaxID=2651974 RepID=UPI00131F7BAE|nr:NnrS family protein [Hydrogenophaga sp. BPS33]QHE86107.1 NnrS family protein [Hydrogenophaga sp. BPS33]